MQNPSPYHPQRLAVIASIVLLHVLALWGLQSGLLQRALVLADEIVIPISVMPELPRLAQPAPVVPPSPARAAPPPKPAPAPVAATQAPVAVAAPQAAPLAVAEAPPSTNAPQGALHAGPAATAPAAAPVAAAKLELPSSDADYLHNPKPRYPNASISRNEQGTVQLLVLVGADGRAKEVKLKTSSGFERLDRAAREAVLGWTFVPAKRGGVPEEMWYELPIPFKLTE